MTDFYRFPKIIVDNCIDEQLLKIEEEINEVCNVFNKAKLYSNIDEIKVELGLELMDVIHATESMLRKNFTDEEVETFQTLVIEKNRQRGYYDKGVDVDGEDIRM